MSASPGRGAASAASPPPFRRDRRLRTALIDAMPSPEPSSQPFTRCNSSSVIPGDGTSTRLEAPPEISQSMRALRGRPCDELDDRQAGHEAPGIGTRMRRFDHANARILQNVDRRHSTRYGHHQRPRHPFAENIDGARRHRARRLADGDDVPSAVERLAIELSSHAAAPVDGAQRRVKALEQQ